VKTILLITLIGAFANLDRRTSLRLMFSQPISTGFLTGVVMGLPMEGFMFGAVLQMMVLGVVSVRGSLVPEFEIGGVVGTALYLYALKFSAMDISVKGAMFFLAIAVALLVSTILAFLYRVWERKSSILADYAVNLARRGEIGKVSAIHSMTILAHFLIGGVMTAVFLFVFTPVIEIMVGWHGLDSLRSLSSLEVFLPFIGVGFLVTFLNTRMKVFWFAVGFLITVVLSFSMG